MWITMSNRKSDVSLVEFDTVRSIIGTVKKRRYLYDRAKPRGHPSGPTNHKNGHLRADDMCRMWTVVLWRIARGSADEPY